MNLHDNIMNIPAKLPSELDKAASVTEAYKIGHRDARHAAAEMANDADEVIAQAKQIIIELCQSYNHPLPEATLAKM